MDYTTDFDKLIKDLDSREINPCCLVSKNSSESTISLFDYLKSVYGKNILSGQQYLQPEEIEDSVYYHLTGRLPAIRGYDFMDIDKRTSLHQWERALNWAKNTGCVITMCWHWYAPDNMSDMQHCDWAFYYKTTDYSKKTSFDIIKAVTPGTLEYNFAIDRIDRAAAALKEFQRENIPVLWRPLHEAAGSWFWWGRRNNEAEKSVEAYKKLWYIFFDRFENYHKLNNLIWVWNGQDKEMAVSPNSFDICGEDIYSEIPQDHSSQKAKFLEVTSYTEGKMAALSECGYMPDPENLKKDGVKWLWWLPWWGSFAYKMDERWKPVFGENGLVLHADSKFTPEMLKSYFDNPYCVTLDKLPWYTKENDIYVKNLMKERFGL